MKNTKHGISALKCNESNSLLLYTYTNGEDPSSIAYRREQLYITARLCFVQVIHAGPEDNAYKAFSIPMTAAEAEAWIEAHVPDIDAQEAINMIGHIADKTKACYTVHQYLYEKMMDYSEETGMRASHIIERALMQFFGYDKCNGLLDNKDIIEKYVSDK